MENKELNPTEYFVSVLEALLKTHTQKTGAHIYSINVSYVNVSGRLKLYNDYVINRIDLDMK